VSGEIEPAADSDVSADEGAEGTDDTDEINDTRGRQVSRAPPESPLLSPEGSPVEVGMNPFSRFNSDLHHILPSKPQTSLANASIEKPIYRSVSGTELLPEQSFARSVSNDSQSPDGFPSSNRFGLASLSGRLSGDPQDRVASVLVNEGGVRVVKLMDKEERKRIYELMRLEFRFEYLDKAETLRLEQDDLPEIKVRYSEKVLRQEGSRSCTIS